MQEIQDSTLPVASPPCSSRTVTRCVRAPLLYVPGVISVGWLLEGLQNLPDPLLVLDAPLNCASLLLGPRPLIGRACVCHTCICMSRLG
jgi:hypothetical protein